MIILYFIELAFHWKTLENSGFYRKPQSLYDYGT